MAWGLPGPFDPRHRPLQPARGFLDLQAPDVSKQLQSGIASILPALAEAYKGTNAFVRNQRAGDDFLAASRAGGTGGVATPGVPGAAATPGTPASPQEKFAGFKPEINGMIASSAVRYGVDEAYLRKLTEIESAGDPGAISSTGAKGLTQFTDRTWKGYGQGGNPLDPQQNLDAAARLTLANKAELTAALGREPTSGELYLAHQQGAGTAVKLLTNPNTPAGQLVNPRNIAVNGGNPNAPASEFTTKWTGRFGGVGPTAVAGTGVAPGAGAVSGGQLADAAGAYKARIQEIFPGVKITSEYRNPQQNQAVGGRSGSQHLVGKALDLDVSGMTEEQKAALIDDAMKNGAKGFGWYNNRSLHIDFRDTPMAWGPDTHRTSLGQTPPWFQQRMQALMAGGAGNVPGPTLAAAPAAAAAPVAAAAAPAAAQGPVQVASANPGFVPQPAPAAQPGQQGPGLFDPAPSAAAAVKPVGAQLAGAPDMQNSPMPNVGLPAQPITGSPSRPLPQPDVQPPPIQTAALPAMAGGGNPAMTLPAEAGGGQPAQATPGPAIVQNPPAPVAAIPQTVVAPPPPTPAVEPPAPAPTPAPAPVTPAPVRPAPAPAPAVQPAPAVAAAAPIAMPPQAAAAANRLGLDVGQLQQMNPRFLSALGHAIKGGDPSMVQAIVGGINAITQASASSARNRQTVQGADGTIYEVTPDGRYVPVIPGKGGSGDDIIVPADDVEGRKKFGIPPNDTRAWKISRDAQGNITKDPISDPTAKEDVSFTQENELSKAFETNEGMRRFKEAHVAVESLDAAFGQATPAGDINGMVQVFKGIDPTSTVSVTETGQIQGSGGGESWAQKWINKINRTGLLTPQDRADFYNAARVQLQKRGGPAKDFYTGIQNRAKARKLDPNAATNNYQFPDFEKMPAKSADQFRENYRPTEPGGHGSPENPVEVYSENQGDALPEGTNYYVVAGPNSGRTGTSNGKGRRQGTGGR